MNKQLQHLIARVSKPPKCSTVEQDLLDCGAGPSKRSPQGEKQRQSRYQHPSRNHTKFLPEGRESHRDDTSKEETIPVGIDIVDLAQRPG